MIRGPDGVDVRAWDHVSPADLVIPLDVHVGRISRMIGLCTSPDSSWRTAEAITAALRTLDAEDPLRFDFALAHLGISDGCSGAFQPTVCGACPLFPGCQVSQRSDARPGIDQADS